MGDADHRHAAAGQLLHQLQNLSDHLGVKGGGRLVKQQHVGVHSQRAHNRNALLLPAGQHVGVGVGLVGQTDALQQLHGFLVGLGLLHQAQTHGGQRDVLLHRQVGEQVEMLEHHAHLLAHMVNVVVGDFLAVEDDMAAVRLLQTVQAAQERGFSAARGADQHNAVALVDGQVHALEHLQAAVVLLQSFNVYHFAPASSQILQAAR